MLSLLYFLVNNELSRSFQDLLNLGGELKLLETLLDFVKVDTEDFAHSETFPNR